MRLLGCCFIIASLSEAERKLQGPEDQIRPNKREEEEEEKKNKEIQQARTTNYQNKKKSAWLLYYDGSVCGGALNELYSNHPLSHSQQHCPFLVYSLITTR